MKFLCTLLIAGFTLGLVACAQIPAVADRPPAGAWLPVYPLFAVFAVPRGRRFSGFLLAKG